MSIVSQHSSASQLVTLTQKRDPFAALGDLEITLILSFLSVKETIVIRGVSTLWKACVDFRLTKAAIGRHFPATEQAISMYPNWEEESLAFRKLAYTRGTQAKPSVARKFEIGTTGQWCVCNHHMVWVDETHINFQRLWDPKNPARDIFPVTRKDLKLIQLEDKPRRFRYPKVVWIAGDDDTGIIVLYLRVPFRENPTHPKWLLAVSVTGKVLWHQKHMYTIRRPSVAHSKMKNTFISFGQEKLCFVDSGDHPLDHSRCVTHCVARNFDHHSLVVINIRSGIQVVRKLLPANDRAIAQGNFGGNWADCFVAHPTHPVCFLWVGQELSVFSTITGDRVENHTIPLSLPSTDPGIPWNNVYFHFGSSGETWLVAERKNSIVGYQIELEKYQIAKQRTWNLTPNDNCLKSSSGTPREWKWGILWSTKLDPISGVLYVVEQEEENDGNSMRIMAIEFEPTKGTSNYYIKSCESLTLPPKRKIPTDETKGKKYKLRGESEKTNNEIELPNGRREFVVPLELSGWRLFWRTGPYFMLEMSNWDHWVCVFGCVPRW